MGCVHLFVSLILWAAAHGQVLYYPDSPEEVQIEEGCKAGLDHPPETQVALFEHRDALVTVTYSENEDNYTENCSTLVHQPDNTTTTVGRYIYLLPLKDGSIVCRDILFFVNGSNPVVCLYYTMAKADITLEIAKRPAVTTIVITSISLIASILLLVTYTIFPSLRTLPSKVIMNLSLSFSLGDVFVITLTALLLAKKDVLVIDIVGVISFYFFHARFLWMALSGFEMCRTVLIGTRLKFDTEHTRKRLLIGYVLFGWGVPFVPTIIMATVHFAVPTNDNRKSTVHMLFGIGGYIVTLVPVGLVILFNIGVLISFSFFIHKAYQWETQLRDALTMQQTKRTTNFTRIFIVVLSILGLSWVTILLIYVDGVESTEAVLITYNILNALQPIFVSAAFIATKKILHKYLSLFGYKKCDEKVTRRRRRRARRLFSFIFTDRELSSITTYNFSKRRQNSGISATSMLTSMSSSPSNGSNSPALKSLHSAHVPQPASDGSDSPTVITPSTPSAPLPQSASDGSDSPSINTPSSIPSAPSPQPASDDNNSPTTDTSSDTAALTRNGPPDIVSHVRIDFKETAV